MSVVIMSSVKTDGYRQIQDIVFRCQNMYIEHHTMFQIYAQHNSVVLEYKQGIQNEWLFPLLWHTCD